MPPVLPPALVKVETAKRAWIASRAVVDEPAQPFVGHLRASDLDLAQTQANDLQFYAQTYLF